MAVSRMKFGLVAAAGLLLSALLVVACTSTPSKSSTPPTSLPLSTTSVASSTTTSVPASPEGLVILLTENSSQAGYYVDGWQGYNEPLFALWPDFRMMVRVAGGYKGEPPVYEEAMLTFPEVAQLRTWAAAADLSTLKDTYTLAGGFSDPLVWRLEVGNTQSAKAVTFERYPFPTDEPGYPARLKTFVDQLMNYRPPGAPVRVREAGGESAPQLASTVDGRVRGPAGSASTRRSPLLLQPSPPRRHLRGGWQHDRRTRHGSLRPDREGLDE